jgi:hypothetical protein
VTGRSRAIEREEGTPTPRQLDHDPLPATSANHHPCRLEPPHVIRRATRGGAQYVVQLADGPRVLEDKEKLRPLYAHERGERPARPWGSCKVPLLV